MHTCICIYSETPANGSSCVIYVHLLGFPSIFLCINRDGERGEWALDLVYTIRYPPSCGRVRTVVDVPRSCGNCSASAKISETSSRRFSQSSPNASTVSKQHSLRDDYFDYAVIIYCISRYSYKIKKEATCISRKALFFQEEHACTASALQNTLLRGTL